MTALNKFLETIEVAGNPLGDKYKAYKMDSTSAQKNMRKIVDLGTCHCSDYFLLKNDLIILIEETQLLKRVNNIRKEYEYLDDGDKDKIVNRLLGKRLQLKAYGAMLVLCRLATRCSDASNLFKDKKYHFWLVASKIDTEDEKRYFDQIQDSLRETLMQVLGRTLLNNVEVMSAEILKNKIAEK